MTAYFLGGPIADKFPPKILIFVSLITTSFGGFILLLSPSVLYLKILYGYWGITTILLFWAPLIRSTREWGGDYSQGRAFGFLDGGRGLTAALMASGGVLILGNSLKQGSGITNVVLYYVFLTAITAFLVVLLLPRQTHSHLRTQSEASPKSLIRNKFLWIQAAILAVCYCCYKGIDHYALYVHEVLGMSETDSAAFATGIAYTRPISAVAAGLIADRFTPSKSILTIFVILIFVYALLASLTTGQGSQIVLFTILISAAGVFALRGIYFAVLAESKIPTYQTGLAVGLISFIGYTPDIFFAPIAGRLLDSAPGLEGHRLYFQMLAVIAIVGLLVTIGLVYFIKKREEHNAK